MPAATNPYYIEPADPLKALMGFDQSYQQARQQKLQDQMQAGRLEAAQALQSGGDPRPALAKLLGIGDVQGANALATYGHQQSQDRLAEATLANTQEYQKAHIGLERDNLDLNRQKLDLGRVMPAPSNPLTGEGGGYVRIGPKGAEPIPMGPSAQPELTPPSNVGPAPPRSKNLSDTIPADANVTVENVPPQQPAQAQPQDKVAAVMQKHGGKPGDGRDWEYLASLPEGTQLRILKTANYEIDPRQVPNRVAQGAGTSARDALITATSKFDKGYDATQFPVRAKLESDFASGTKGDVVRSMDVAISHIDAGRKLISALNSGNSQLINRARNYWQEITGKPAPGNLEAASEIIGDEVTKAVLGTGNSALGDRQSIKSKFSAARSPDQLNGVFDTYESLLGGQLEGLFRQYTTNGGKKDLTQHLAPRTRDVLLGHSPQGGGAQPPPTGVIRYDAQGNRVQ